MARRKPPNIPDALLNRFLAGADPKRALNANGLLELKKALVASRPPRQHSDWPITRWGVLTHYGSRFATKRRFMPTDVLVVPTNMIQVSLRLNRAFRWAETDRIQSLLARSDSGNRNFFCYSNRSSKRACSNTDGPW